MQLNHITVIVSDIEKSKKFYKDSLNLDVSFEKEISGDQYSIVTGYKDLKLKFAALKIPNSKTILELAQFVNPNVNLTPDFRHIAFEVDNVDEIYNKLKSQKVNIVSEPITISSQGPGLDGKRFFYFKDLDNNLIEILNKKEDLYSK